MNPPSMYQRLGAEPALRSIIEDFVDRVYDDVMIGFFFRSVPRRRIQELEYQHAAEFLGAPQSYRGRPLREAHAAHPIMGGQFARRIQILRDVLQAHAVPPDIAQAWLEHNESLRPLITGDGAECNAQRAAQRVRPSDKRRTLPMRKPSDDPNR